MVGSYSNNAFGSGFPQPTGMGNGYRRNPASTRQNQIGNGPNPTGAQTVGPLRTMQHIYGQEGQLRTMPHIYGQEGQLQQASGMQPLDTQTAMFNLFNVMKKHRSNVYQPQQEQQYQLTGLPQQKKTWNVSELDRHLEGDAADEAMQQQQYPQTPPPQQQTSNVYPLSNAAGAMVDTRSREPLDIADPSSQQAQQQQAAPPQQSGYGADMPLPTPQEQRRQRAIAPRDPTMTPHNRMALGAKNLTEGDWKTLVDQNLGASAMPADEEKFLQFVQANSQFFPTDGQYNMGQMAVSGEDLLEFIMELDPAVGNVYPQQQQQTTEQALMSKGAANLTGEDWSTLVNRTMGGGATQGDRNKFFNFVQENSEFFPTDIPDYEDLLEYILDLPAPTRQQAPLELGSNVNPQQAQQPQAQQPRQPSAFSQAQQAQQPQQPQQRQLSAFSQALADSNVNPQPAATPRQRQMANMRNSASSTAAGNSYAREIRIAKEMGLDPEKLGLSREGLKQQKQRQQSYADRAGTGRGQEFKLPPNQQLLAQKQAMEQNAAQQEAAINGSPAYQRAYNGRVKAFGSKGLTDEENAKQQQNEAELQQKYEDDLAGMRNDRANREFAMTPGGAQMGRFAKLLAQRGQQPQQGQYQSNVEQPTKNSQDALKRYYDDGDPATDRNGNSTPTLRSFTNAVGQKMLIKKSDDGRYALTGSGRRTPEDVARIADERQERLANASPALQKRAFDTARRRGQPRGNAVSNAMLRKQGLSPEQISNVYAGTQDKETTQLMRQPQSAVGPAVNGLPNGTIGGLPQRVAEHAVKNRDLIANGGAPVDMATGEPVPPTEEQLYDADLLKSINVRTDLDAARFMYAMRSEKAQGLQSMTAPERIRAARTIHSLVMDKIQAAKGAEWSGTGSFLNEINAADKARIDAAKKVDPTNDEQLLAWIGELQDLKKLTPKQQKNRWESDQVPTEIPFGTIN